MFINFVTEILEVCFTVECEKSLSSILSKTRRLSCSHTLCQLLQGLWAGAVEVGAAVSCKKSIVCTNLVIAMDVTKIGQEYVGWSLLAEYREKWMNVICQQ